VALVMARNAIIEVGVKDIFAAKRLALGLLCAHMLPTSRIAEG
jgi:hypothetical protein